MCGITGILHFGHIQKSEEIVSIMSDTLLHRGPDAGGLYSDEFISLGHRRLSIIDLGDRANQPLIDINKRYVLSFNGEIYNYKEIKQDLSNWQFTTDSDTEVLLAAFTTWGVECINRLDGIFVFAVWDKIEKTLWLVRDRMGVKPLYFFIEAKTIVFASELRSLLSSRIIPARIANCGLAHYMSFQNVSNDFPIINGVRELESGTYLKVTIDQIKKSVYWRPNLTIDNKPLQYENIVKNTFQLLDKSVKKRMVSDVPISAYLSGGVDSSAIVALMSLHSNDPINTFTLSFKDSIYDESTYANIIAKRFATNHTNIILSEDQLLNVVINGLNVMDSPSADGINTYILSNAIKSANIKVALSGIGADELFAGYPGFGYFQQIQQRSNLFNNTRLLRKGLAQMLCLFYGDKYSKLNQLLNATDHQLHSVYPAMRQFISPKKLKTIYKDESCKTIVKHKLISDLSMLQHPYHLSEFSLAEYQCYAKHTLLRDVDQMSMANGLEVREPFFDVDLIEYVLSIPDQYKTGRSPKQLLLDAINPLLPIEITKRKKKGFVLPWEKWMRAELRTFCESQIKECSDREFINKFGLMSYWTRFLKNDTTVQWIEIWQFVVLNYWMNKNNIVYKA